MVGHFYVRLEQGEIGKHPTWFRARKESAQHGQVRWVKYVTTQRDHAQRELAVLLRGATQVSVADDGTELWDVRGCPCPSPRRKEGALDKALRTGKWPAWPSSK